MRLSSSLLLLQGAVALAHESVAIVTATEPETIVKCTTYVTQEVVTYLTTLYPHGTTGTVSTPHGESTSSFSGYRNPSKSSKYPPVESTSSSTSYPPKTETHRGHSTPRVSASTWKFHNSTSSLFSSTTSLSSLSTSSSSVVTSGSLITSTSQNSTSSTSSASQNSTSSTSTYIPQSTGCPLDACATEVRSNLDDCSSLLLVTVYPSTITATAYITLSNSSLFFTTPTSTETFTETEYPFTAISSTTSTILESTTVSTSVSTSLTTVTTSTQTIADIVTTTVTSISSSSPLDRRGNSTPGSIVSPSSVPIYANSCRGAMQYSSACSCAGVTKSTTTMPTPTYTFTSILPEITSFTTEVFVTSIVRFTETDSTTITSDVLASTTVTSTSSSIAIVTPTASANAVCENGAFVDGLSVSCPEAPCNSYNLRIEGDTDTIYEGIILAGPRTITTASGGTHLCDGTNGGANTVPGGTSTSAMDAATGLCGFVYDGTFDTAFDDYFITSISDSAETSTMFWGLLNNFQFAPYGGCGNEPSPGDSILWAYDAFNKASFLDVSPSTASLSVGEIAEFTVTDGSTGTLVSGATFNGLLSNAEGVVPYVAREPGTFRLKASKSNAIRSPVVVITVS